MIRRPMLFAACGCGAAVVLCCCAGPAVALAVLPATETVMLLRGARGEMGRRRIVAVLILVSYSLGLISFLHADRTLTEEAGQIGGRSVCGEITDCGKRVTQSGEPYLQMTVKTDQGSVLCKIYDSCRVNGAAEEGCRAECRGQLKAPEGKRNPGCFDYALYLRSLRVSRIMTCDAVTIFPVRSFTEAPLPFLKNRVYMAREGFLEKLASYTDVPTAGLIRAVLFGDKGGLDDAVLETFRKNGTAHILAVSGLHIGIIYGFILILWRWRRGWAFLLFNTAFFLLYAAAAGFSPSVTRAVIMVLAHIAAGVMNRRYDLANAAFFVFLAVILRNPFMVFNSGFQMSFLAVLSLTLVLPYLKKIYSGVFLASAAVQVGLGPFILFSFNWLSLLTVFINVPVVALTGIIVPVALASMALSPFGMFQIPAYLLKPLCAALVRLNEVTQADGITTFQVVSPPLWIMAVYYLGLLLFATEEGRLHLLRAVHKGRYVFRMMVIIIAFSTGFAAFASDGFEDCDLTFVDVGQGDCICVRTEGGLAGRDGCYLFDGGGNVSNNVGKSVLRDYLLKNGVSHVDGAFVTHLHTDHYKGICEIAQLGMVDRLYVYEANRLKASEILEDTGLSEEKLCFVAGGDRINLNYSGLRNTDFVYIDILQPSRRSDVAYKELLSQETDENLLSLVFRVTFSGRQEHTGVLITGDMGEEGENDLIRSDIHSEILKVGHHGSKNSTTEAFLTAVDPEIAVIQVGRDNMYGHPAPETLDRLANHGAVIYRNDIMGAVGFEIKGGSVKKVRTMINDD